MQVPLHSSFVYHVEEWKPCELKRKSEEIAQVPYANSEHGSKALQNRNAVLQLMVAIIVGLLIGHINPKPQRQIVLEKPNNVIIYATSGCGGNMDKR